MFEKFEKLEGSQSLDISCCKAMLVIYKDGHLTYSNDVFIPDSKSKISHVLFLKYTLSAEEASFLISSIERTYSILNGVFPLLLRSFSDK